MAARIVSALFVFLLIVGVPVLSLTTARDDRLRQMRRLELYVSAAISQWALAVVGVGVFFLGSLSAFSVGFRGSPRHCFHLGKRFGCAVRGRHSPKPIPGTPWVVAGRKRADLPLDSQDAPGKSLVAASAGSHGRSLRGILVSRLASRSNQSMAAYRRLGVRFFIAGVRTGACLSRLERGRASLSARGLACLSRHSFRQPLSFHARAWTDRCRGLGVAGSKVSRRG